MSERAPSRARAVLRVLRERPGAACALGGLATLTVLAALPFAPEGPFDARDWSRVGDVRLEFPAAGALVEPVAALGHVVAGSPDIRVTGASMLAWVVLVGGAASLALALRRGRGPLGAALRTLGGAAAWTGVFLAWVAFSLLVRLPSWRLETPCPDLAIADLQSHTFGSHDGLVSARESLEWHAARGYDVVAVTEHDDPRGAFEAAALARTRGVPVGVIPGIEWREPGGGYLLGIDLDSAKRPPTMARPPASAETFAGQVRDDHNGATLALAWKLDAERVRGLASAGIDGFEIANAGHPDIPDDVRGAILEEASARGLVLVASTDWHGWGGFARTWSVVRAPGVKKSTPEAKAKAVVAALRERRAADITPVVAGYMGPPSTARAVFTPFIELARYAMELSAPRVLAWWVWAIALAGAAGLLRRARVRPGRVLLAAFLAVLGAGLVYEGTRLLGAWAAGATSTAFPARVGGWGLGLGLAALTSSVTLVALEVRGRRGTERPAPTASEPEAKEGDAG